MKKVLTYTAVVASLSFMLTGCNNEQEKKKRKRQAMHRHKHNKIKPPQPLK